MPSVVWYEQSIGFYLVSLAGGGVAALNTLIPPTPGASAAPKIACDRDSGVFYGLVTTTGPNLAWDVIGTGSAPTINIATFAGGGAHVVAADTDLVLLDLGGASATLTLPLLSDQQPGRNVRVVLLSDGFVEILPSGADPLWSGAASLQLGSAGNTVLLTPTAQWTVTDLFGALVDFTVYVDLAGNDDATGSQTAPLATLQEALKRAGRLSWTRYGIIRMNAGVFVQPDGVAIVTPSGTGGQALALQVIGTEVDSGLGTLTVSVFTPVPVPFDSPIGGVITLAAPLLGATNYAGWRARMLSGAYTDYSFEVASNTAATIMLCDNEIALGALDTFVLERPDTTLVFSDLAVPALLRPSFSGSPLMLRSLRTNCPQRLLVQETQIFVQHVWCDCSGAGFRTLSIFGGGELYAGSFVLGGFGPRTGPGDDPRMLDRTGLFCFGSDALDGVECRENGLARLYQSVFSSASLRAINDSFCEFTQSQHTGAGFVGNESNGGACVANYSRWTASVPGAGRGAVTCRQGASSVYGCAFNGCTGNAIQVERHGCGDITQCEGAGNTGAGLAILSHSTYQTNAPNTVTGAAGDVILGGIGAITWAAASAGANDLAAGAASQLCYVGP